MENDYKWYVVHTYSGHENKVKITLEKKIEGLNDQLKDLEGEYGSPDLSSDSKINIGKKLELLRMSVRIKEVRIPTIDVPVSKDGKKKVVQKKFFPGYIIVNMEMNNETWITVKAITGVTNFVGAIGTSKPKPLSKSEVDLMFDRSGVEKARDKSSFSIDFYIGEHVKVTEGPFSNFTGVVEEVVPEKGKLRIKVEIFGRGTSVELDFTHVSRI